MPYKIITHDGKAHMDELLASALIALHLNEEPVQIDRIDSQEVAKMVSEGRFSDDTYFIDCGMVYDSKRKLYDHHQDKDCDSAALLIFNEFFPHLKDSDLHRYIELVSKVDTRGAMSLDDFDLISESREYLTFSQGILLRSFSDDPMPVLRIFIDGLGDKINFEQLKAEAALWLDIEGHVEMIRVDGLNVLKYLQKPPAELVSPLRSASGPVIDKNEIAAILSFDDKIPEAKTFYRTDYGHDLVDFSLSNPKQTIFKHHGGFLMKFIPSSDDEWIDIIKAAHL